MSLPAVILCEIDPGSQKIAALLLLDRLVVAAHRAGAAPVKIFGAMSSLPLRRSAALGITFEYVDVIPPLPGATLVISNRVLVQSADLKRLVAQGGRLTDRNGIGLPVAMVEDFSLENFPAQLAALPALKAVGVVQRADDAPSRQAAEMALWASLGSAADGLVDRYFNRPVGRVLSKILVHTEISPNQVSIGATLIGLLAAFLFACGTFRSAVAGAFVLQFSAIVDCVDGDLARILCKESRLGKWLDIVGDQVVHVAVFAGIGYGLFRTDSVAHPFLLTLSAVVGVGISFFVVVWSGRRPQGKNNPRLQRLIEATTNRDFSVLLIVLALCQKLAWFLWMTAIGVHLFWLAALSLQCAGAQVQQVRNFNREKSA